MPVHCPYVTYHFFPVEMAFLTAEPMMDRLQSLQTTISYDRIYVMDNGNIAKFDASDVLHEKDGIFLAMCDHSNIMLDDRATFAADAWMICSESQWDLDVSRTLIFELQ